MDGEVGEQRLGLLVRDRRVDDDIVALLPVHGGGDKVLVADLESYAHAIANATVSVLSRPRGARSRVGRRTIDNAI